jgi:hypothetical protein
MEIQHQPESFGQRVLDHPVERLKPGLTQPVARVGPGVAERMQIDSHMAEARLADQPEVVRFEASLRAIAPDWIISNHVDAPAQALILLERVWRSGGWTHLRRFVFVRTSDAEHGRAGRHAQGRSVLQELPATELVLGTHV